ncbi:MAG: Ig-like domain-containing protein, partial [Marinilabiliaceae bacterium]
RSGQIPFSTNDQNLTIWNGDAYIPFFVKGTNLGVAVPGTYPGELAASREQYRRWFKEIKAAGFNAIRLYTLHYPRFYEELKAFNTENADNPLLFFQGIWLNESLEGYADDLYFMTDTFDVEIDENVDCVHGNRIIDVRFGKAFGEYTADVSDWCLGYIIGREIHPGEVITTNENNGGHNHFQGNHFSIDDASPTEVWVVERFDHLVSYEHNNYETQRPVSLSSWPTLDPMHHPEEEKRDEDSASIDLANINSFNAPAGYFVSYHAYPYYPDFISQQSSYQDFYDHYGPNSYIGYLTELKAHYKDVPLIIAEFGVPSSWAAAHYASSGLNHGGFDEKGQGEANIRMLQNIENTDCGGGIHFAWIDEWFKRTWVTDPLDYEVENRILWHNIAAAEQNYGLKSFSLPSEQDTVARFTGDLPVTELRSCANHGFFELEIDLTEPFGILNEMWVALDTYDPDAGELLMPSGIEIPIRSEFLLHITNYSAKLYVTQAYDTYGIWHHVSGPEQLYRSVPTEGHPWNIVRYKNNYPNKDVQFVGDLQVRRFFQPKSSLDAVTIYNQEIRVRLPWTYLNFVAPNLRKVLDDDRDTPETETAISDGIKIAVRYRDQWYEGDHRFNWEDWTTVPPDEVRERLKSSYYVMQEQLSKFNSPVIAVRDSFSIQSPYPFTTKLEQSVLNNDFDLDGTYKSSLLAKEPGNGQVVLYGDGTFRYTPDPGFNGVDTFEYAVYDGQLLSSPGKVVLNVESNNQAPSKKLSEKADVIRVYPNPAEEFLTINSEIAFQTMEIVNLTGNTVLSFHPDDYPEEMDVSFLPPGLYFIVGKLQNQVFSRRFVKN